MIKCNNNVWNTPTHGENILEHIITIIHLYYLERKYMRNIKIACSGCNLFFYDAIHNNSNSILRDISILHRFIFKTRSYTRIMYYVSHDEQDFIRTYYDYKS